MTSLSDAIRRLQATLVAEFHTSPDLFDEIARMEALLAETYRDRFLYELLQNSDDAGSTVVRVHTGDSGSLTWSNDGRPLTVADVESLCRSARSTKQRGDFIGYRGIGFKSLAAVATTITVESADARFAFDRTRSAELVGARTGTSMPLIRIPSGVQENGSISGVRFAVVGKSGAAFDPGIIDPLALLFLRNVRRMELAQSRTTVLETTRRGGELTLSRTGHADAVFAIRGLSSGDIAIPLNAAAVSLTGVRGRLSCFLPLSDQLGIPAVVSGMVLTDPSRTHAVTDDDGTREVVRDAARAIVEILNTPDDPAFDRMWELLTEAEDPRATISSPAASVPYLFWSEVQDAARSVRWKFEHSPIGYGEKELSAVLPPGAPRSLYLDSNRAAAKALKAVLGLPLADISQQMTKHDLPQLGAATRTKIAEHIVGTARAFGRALTPAEELLVGAQPPSAVDEPTPAPAVVKPVGRGTPLAEHMHRWQAAEKAVVSYLGHLGWQLEDVSQQNLGYDLTGRDARNQQVYVEVKKVDRSDARFSITNNEMSFLHARRDEYWLAMVVGEGRGARLMMIHAGSVELPFERVCRRWDWECSEWSSAGQLV